MKQISRKLALILGLAMSLSLVSEPSQNAANASSPAQRGGGGHAGGHGGGRHAGGGHAGGGGGMHAGGGGIRGGRGMHAPPIGGPGHIGGNGGGVGNIGASGGSHIAQRPPTNHAPSLSHPNPGSIRSGITHLPGQGNHSIGNRTGVAGGLPGNRPGPGNNGINGRHDAHIGIAPVPLANRQSGIGNRQYNGNSLNFNNRRFNIGSNNYRPSYYRHAGYHGYWNGNRGYGIGSRIGYGPGSNFGNRLLSNMGYGWGLGNGYGSGNRYGHGGRYQRYGGFGYRPLGWGLGGWGLGSLIYNSGYLGYSNPYYSNGGWNGYNYSQPITVSYNSLVTVIDNAVESGSPVNSSDQVLNSAVAAFQQNDYDAALDITNKGITQFPDDAVLHEFRSLVLFAKQDFQQSAATIHSVLAVGPGWDWTTLSGMYSNAEVYTTQLRDLEAFTKSNPQDAAAHFLLAYHYLSCGHPDAAARHLQQVVTLMPNDLVAADMLKMVATPTAEETATAPAPDSSEQLQPEIPAIDPKSLVGAWHATREDGSAFSLNLTNGAEFTWSFAQNGQAAQEFGGTYSIEGNVLLLERKDGGSLIAEITPGDASKFNFKMLGAADDDHGLNFSK